MISFIFDINIQLCDFPLLFPTSNTPPGSKYFKLCLSLTPEVCVAFVYLSSLIFVLKITLAHLKF